MAIMFHLEVLQVNNKRDVVLALSDLKFFLFFIQITKPISFYR